MVEPAGIKVETAPFYWDQNDATRAFSKRFSERFKSRMPNFVQASAYGAVMHYLEAVPQVGTDAGPAVLAAMRATPINDFRLGTASSGPDGQVMRDMYVFRAKAPADSKSEWDLMKQSPPFRRPKPFRPRTRAVLS